MRRSFLVPVLLALLVLGLLAVPAGASAAAPWDGSPISPLLQPPWPVPPQPGDGTYNRQDTSGGNIANIPYASVAPLLAQFQTEATAAGVAPRMDYFVIGQTAGGRDLYGVVINALDTPQQQQDYANWQQVQKLALSDPVAAQALLAGFGDDVKIPIFIEASIHGNEYEGVDGTMQAIRDLVTTPYGANATVDKLLDHAVLIINPVANPDGRVQGTRSNGAGVDMNRDGFVQSQPEIRHSWKFMFDWLPVAGIGFHGYYNPTLIDGLTMPHNPGVEWDIFGHWNQLRTEANRAAFYAANRQVQRPVNDWSAAGSSTSQYTITASPAGATQSGSTVTITTTGNATQIVVGAKVSVLGVGDSRYNGVFTVSAKPTTTSFQFEHPTYSGLPASGGGTAAITVGSPNRGPAFAQGWDDWGPFYGQTIMATVGVDSSTIEVPSTSRIEGKTCVYLGFYSSLDFWVDNRSDMLSDQLERFRRGVTDAPWNPTAIADDPVLAARGFDDYWHNWMYDYPRAYIIPFGAEQRSDIEANRLARFLLDNRVEVSRATAGFSWNGTTYEAGSYIVWMDQAMRGLAREALSSGIDIVTKITDLYAPPAAWSHGLVWGADTFEVPRGDSSFAPVTSLVDDTNELSGGVRDGLDAPSDWYAVSLKGVREFRAVMDLLDDGVRGDIAEVPFDSTTGGRMPAGSLVFPADPVTAAKLDALGEQVGVWFERNVGIPMPASTRVTEAPKIAVLRNSYGPPPYVPFGVMTRIFGPDNVGYVTTGGSGAISLSDATVPDPLLKYDFIWNEQGSWPSNATARSRLNAFFARGGGYFGDNYQANNYTFLTASGLVTGSLTQGSTSNANTFGGIHKWVNVAGETSPLIGAYPAVDTGFVPSRIWWFTAIPSGAVVDARYAPDMTTIGGGWVSGMWLNRGTTPGADNGVLLARGMTTAGSRYVIHSSDLTTRFDPERSWLLIGQAALWGNLTDEVTLDEGPASQDVQYSDAVTPLVIGAHDADTAGSALQAAASGLPDGVTLTRVGDNGDTVPGAASWRVAGEVSGPAGTYDVTVTVGDAMRTTGSVSFKIVVKQEDAALFYNGSDLVPTGTYPTLGSQFWDSAAAGYPGPNAEPGGTIGDIAKAWVGFSVKTISGTSVGSAYAPVADTATPGDGIGSASVTSPWKSSSDAVWLVTTTIVKDGMGATPNLFYAAPDDLGGMIVFYSDTGQFATGGGTIPEGDGKANFGFVARYNKNGKPQGQVVYVFRGLYKGTPATFQVKSNALSGLAFSGKAYPISSTLTGSCSITVTSSTGTALFGQGNWRFKATVVDTDANPGTGSDSFAITIWDRSNQLYKNVPATPLSGGNIKVKNPK